MMEVIRAIIVDDELPARHRVEDLLGQEADIQVVGRCSSGKAAVDLIRSERPDLVFLDIQMPEFDGFDVIEQVGAERMPTVIFVTAYNQFALKAFESCALDYLLKPYDDERFRQALDRAREQIRLRRVDTLSEQLITLLKARNGVKIDAEKPPEEDIHLRFIPVKTREETLFVPVEEIDYIKADGPYAELHAKRKVHLVRERMGRLEGQLDPRQFCRIHRSHIVNLNRVKSLQALFRGDSVVKLHDGTRLRVSRSRRDELQKRLGKKK